MKAVITVTLATFATSAMAVAAPQSVTATARDGGRPPRPSAPPPLARRAPQERPRCERQFVYQGKMLPCDSPMSYDGENLRPILRAVPESLAELEEYQAGRKRVESLAYVGTAGLAVALVGYLISRSKPFPENVAIRNSFAIPGLAVLGGSFVFGLVSLSSNEEHLEKAVDLHNQARPERPIELKLSVEF